MDTLEWRGKARVVAVMDLILTSMYLVLIIFSAILAAVAGDEKFIYFWETIYTQARNNYVNFSWIMWIVVAIEGILTFIQLWAAVLLLNATNVGRQLHETLGKAAIWRIVTVVFLIIDICGFLFLPYSSNIIGIVEFVIRVLFFCIVCKFMSEVKSRLTRSPFPGPFVVIVKH